MHPALHDVNNSGTTQVLWCNCNKDAKWRNRTGRWNGNKCERFWQPLSYETYEVMRKFPFQLSGTPSEALSSHDCFPAPNSYPTSFCPLTDFLQIFVRSRVYLSTNVQNDREITIQFPFLSTSMTEILISGSSHVNLANGSFEYGIHITLQTPDKAKTQTNISRTEKKRQN